MAIQRIGAEYDRRARDLTDLLARYALRIVHLPDGAAIAGSYWGEPEAGLQAGVLFVRADTPMHSALHEASHYVCMSAARRVRFDTDAGGDDHEECAVCYLSVLLAEALPGYDRAAMFTDMDAWGYSFRLASARAWFERDAVDARDWLRSRDLINGEDRPTWRLVR